MSGDSIKTERLLPDPDGIRRAGDLLRAGKLVAFPTETVYGLGADARNSDAVAQIFAAKDRPEFNPLIVHVVSFEAAKAIATFNPEAMQLAQAFWPGPLTLVLPLKDSADLSPLVTAGLQHVAIRVPAHPLAQALLKAAGCPVAAPSANPSGRISPTEASHVMAGLSGRIDAVMDGGPCEVGLESTIIGFDPAATLLRPGGLSVEAVEACLDQPLLAHTSSDKPTAPGQLASHYAPRARLRLNVTEPHKDERLLGFGPVEAVLNLSISTDLVEAAANLFHHLHVLDADSDAPIAVSPIPDHGLGHAINERLRRAAAPRP